MSQPEALSRPVCSGRWGTRPDITGVAETIGSAASAAGKSLQCNYGSGTATCLVVGFNTTSIGNGTVATFAFTIGSGTTSTSVPVTLSGTLPQQLARRRFALPAAAGQSQSTSLCPR